MQTYRFRNESRFRSEHSTVCSYAAHALQRLRRGSAPTNRAGQIDRPYGGDKDTWKPISTFDTPVGHALKTCLNHEEFRDDDHY